jgi:CheY-like chemotaxis protein
MTTTLSMDLCLNSESSRDYAESDYRILVVDDEFSIRELVSETLGEAGYRVETAANAMEALEKLHSEHYDLLLTDYHMPRKSGLELIIQIRAEGLDMPAVLMTGRSAELLALYPDLQVSVVLPKPFMIDELLGVVSNVLDSNKLGQTPIATPECHLSDRTLFRMAGRR